MKNYLVKDLTVPISEYATVVVGTSLIDAMQTLEQAQNAYTMSKYQHRAVLVFSEDGNIVGKISQSRVLKAIEPDLESDSEIEQLKKLNFSEKYISQLQRAIAL